MAAEEDTGIRSVDEVRVVGADPWLETRLDHPEDVAVADDGTLYVGGEGGQLAHVDPASNEVEVLASTDGFVLGVALDRAGDLYACDFQSHAVYRLPLEAHRPSGPLETVVSGGPEQPPWHPNYSVFDRAGRLYVSDSGDRSDLANAGGCIYMVDPDGTGRVLTEAVSAFPNGMALSGDGGTLYVAETGTHTVKAVELENGEATGVSTVTDGMGLIDGLALDAEDRLYGASIGDDAIYRLDTGEVEVVVADPTGLTIGNPTNLAFGGLDMHTLYIANLGLWHVSAVEIDVAGRYPTGRL